MLLYCLILAGSVLLDQLTKLAVVKWLMPVGEVPLWNGVLHLTYVENRGAAFGMLSNHRWVFMVFSTVAIVAILIYLLKFPPKNRLFGAVLVMIAGGGIGNMIDRIRLGYVIDFIDFRLINFYVFNVADAFVTVGAVCMIACILWDEVREAKAKKAQENENAE